MAMDLFTSPTIAQEAQNPTTVTPSFDSDTETPPPPPQLTPKRVIGNILHAPFPPAVVSYKECLKNHAASVGGHALDGCCEFMPGPTASFSDPTSLTCGACGCHRNFHRRDPDDPIPLHHHPPARQPHSPPSASQILLSLSAQSPSRPSDEIKSLKSHPTAVTLGYDHHHHHHHNGGQIGKRFRTKFSQEQKEKMYEFSEKIGWKLRKGEEKLVEDFCKQIRVVRGVFKVWMHNNKHSSSSLRKSNHTENQQQQRKTNNNNNNNGSCSTVVDHHPFYKNININNNININGGQSQQEAQ